MKNERITWSILTIIFSLVVSANISRAEYNLKIPTGKELSAYMTSSPENLDKHIDEPTTSLYVSAVSEKLYKVFFSWPKGDKGEKVYGAVVIVLVIGEDGSLLEVYSRGMANSSHTIDVATKIAKQAAPFPAPPEQILKGKKAVQLSRRFDFSSAAK